MTARAVLILVVLAGFVVASAIAVVYARHESRHAFVALTALEAERDELDIEFGQLQLEQATWAETNRIEKIATSELGMLFPGAPETKVIRR